MAVYDERHVSVLADALRIHGNHELICVQDGSFDIPGSIMMPKEIAALPNYLPKLWAWSPEFHSIIKRSFTFIDLDVFIFDDISSAVNTKYLFHCWNDAKLEAYNSSLFHLQYGYGHNVWQWLTPERLTDAKAKARRWTGDQSWIEYILGSNMPTFGRETGIIRYGPRGHKNGVPDGTKAMFLCGPYEPISEGNKLAWINQRYRIVNA